MNDTIWYLNFSQCLDLFFNCNDIPVIYACIFALLLHTLCSFHCVFLSYSSPFIFLFCCMRLSLSSVLCRLSRCIASCSHFVLLPLSSTYTHAACSSILARTPVWHVLPLLYFCWPPHNIFAVIFHMWNWTLHLGATWQLQTQRHTIFCFRLFSVLGCVHIQCCTWLVAPSIQKYCSLPPYSMLVTLFWHCERARVLINKYIAYIYIHIHMHVYVICMEICLGNISTLLFPVGWQRTCVAFGWWLGRSGGDCRGAAPSCFPFEVHKN